VDAVDCNSIRERRQQVPPNFSPPRPCRFAWFFTAACLFNWKNNGNQKTFSKHTFGRVLLKEAGFGQGRDIYFCQKACNIKKNAQKAVYFYAKKQLFLSQPVYTKHGSTKTNIL